MIYTPHTLEQWNTGRIVFTVLQISFTHRRIEVSCRGRIYVCTLAAEENDPAIHRETIEQVWHNERQSFRAYDQSQGCYC